MNLIFSIQKTDSHKIINFLGIKFKFKLNSTNEIQQIKDELANFKHQFLKTIPKTDIHLLTVDVVGHCNLNCVHCDHFSPLAKEEFYDINVFEKEIKRLSELAPNGEIKKLSLQGGEPLLAPNIKDFIEIAAKYLSKTKISIISNGILVNNMDESFWLLLNKHNVLLELTKYPIKVDYDNILKKAERYSVETRIVNIDKKSSYKAPLDLEGKQDVRESYLNCYHANNCVALKDGKIYTCTIAPNIERFNKYFDKHLELSERDGIDIFKVNSLDDILTFLARPIPFCRYCKTKERTFGHEWMVSKKDIEEWI